MSAPQAGDDRQSTWRALLLAAAVALLAVADAGGQQDPAGGRRDAQAISGYRQILEAWANGAGIEAAHDLVALEQRWIAELGELQGFHVKTLSRLVRRDHRCLVSVARLHQQAFRLYTESPQIGPSAVFELQRHSMTMNDQAVRLGLKHGERIPEVRRHAALLLTSMAAQLREQRFLVAASQRLLRATELDRELAVAFEWGGSGEEQLSRLGSAARLLRRLIELEPDNYRGRLRLAMVESKRGGDGARELLAGIVDSDHRSWVWVFAACELALLDARAGRRGDALALLRRALEEVPDDQGLAVALAFLDRAHRGRSRAALEALEARPALASARAAYGGWEGQEDLAATVDALAARHLPHLDEALYWTDPERR